jgi:hypothetical protein
MYYTWQKHLLLGVTDEAFAEQNNGDGDGFTLKLSISLLYKKITGEQNQFPRKIVSLCCVSLQCFTKSNKKEVETKVLRDHRKKGDMSSSLKDAKNQL